MVETFLNIKIPHTLFCVWGIFISHAFLFFMPCHLSYPSLLFHFNPEWSLQCIQVFLDANLPFGIAPYIIFAPCCTEVIAVLFSILQAALQAQGMTGGTIVLLVEELVVSVVDALREEYTHENLRVVHLDVVGRVGIAYVILGKGLALGIFLMDRETGSEIGGMGQAIIPYGHLVEVAALVERDDAMLYHVLLVAYGRWVVGEFYGETEWTVVKNLVGLIAIRQN